VGYVASPESVIELDGAVTGRVRVVVVGGDCLYLDANTNGGSDDAVGVTLRGVRYLASCHAYRRDDGVWGIGREFAPTDHHAADLHLTRPWDGSRGRDISAAARRDVLAALVDAAQTFGDANPDALTEGASAADARELSRIADKRARLVAELDALDDERIAVERGA